MHFNSEPTLVLLRFGTTYRRLYAAVLLLERPAERPFYLGFGCLRRGRFPTRAIRILLKRHTHDVACLPSLLYALACSTGRRSLFGFDPLRAKNKM